MLKIKFKYLNLEIKDKIAYVTINRPEVRNALDNNTANEIKKLFRTNDIIARIGGDEFLILMKDVSDYELVKKRCQQLVDSIHSFFNQEISCCNSSCSIGIAFAPIHGISYEHLFQLADHALYDAKNLGKNRYAIYNENID